MAEGINITGRVDVQLQFAIPGSLVDLGESLDMVDIEDRAFFNNVPGDRYGGPQGPPIDAQWLGMQYIIRIELSRWDPVQWDILKKRQVNATAGTLVLTEVGTLMFGGDNAFRLLLLSTTRPVNFPACILRDSATLNMGTKFTTLGLQLEAHVCQDGTARDGVLYNSDTGNYSS
jgi:hypothetical protein